MYKNSMKDLVKMRMDCTDVEYLIMITIDDVRTIKK